MSALWTACRRGHPAIVPAGMEESWRCAKDLHPVRRVFEALWTRETRLFYAAFWAGSMVTVAVLAVTA